LFPIIFTRVCGFLIYCILGTRLDVDLHSGYFTLQVYTKYVHILRETNTKAHFLAHKHGFNPFFSTVFDRVCLVYSKVILKHLLVTF